jgi:hypothetical protein
VIRFHRQRLAREAIMAAKEISVKKYVVAPFLPLLAPQANAGC